MTSHDVVARQRRRYDAKASHAGTLDPFATGLLIVLLGRAATRERQRFMALHRDLPCDSCTGAVSTTGDPDGEITETGVLPARSSSCRSARSVAPAGVLRRQGGRRRAYRRARRGEEVELPERLVTVHRFEQLERAGERAEFEIECSSGTYVRSLIAELGDAYCERLRRVRIGPFAVEEADEDRPLELADALGRVR